MSGAQILSLTPKHGSVDHINLSEWFGPTIQGEGPMAGRLSSFVRLSGCNLTCSWCDSAYTWDWEKYGHKEEVHPKTIEEAVAIVRALPGRIIITGGEPLLQSAALARIMSALPRRAFDVETNGTRPLAGTAPFWDSITCSPKITPSAGQPERAGRIDKSVLDHPRVIFKFVCADDADLDAALEFAARKSIPKHQVWLMPEGVTTDVLTARSPWLMEAATRAGVNFTNRLHVYGWGEKRGH